MKIFNVSLHRSGTKSFHAFCQANGISSLHWPGHDFDASIAPAMAELDRDVLWQLYAPLLDQVDACSDLPAPNLYERAYAAFPDAKFVMVRRNPESWVASVRRHMTGRNFANLEAFLYWSATGRREARIDGYSDAELLGVYDRHTVAMASFFITRRANFRVFWLEDPMIGARMGQFLGVADPVPFPRVDETA